jgi:hypothetical protein
MLILCFRGCSTKWKLAQLLSTLTDAENNIAIPKTGSNYISCCITEGNVILKKTNQGFWRCSTLLNQLLIRQWWLISKAASRPEKESRYSCIVTPKISFHAKCYLETSFFPPHHSINLLTNCEIFKAPNRNDQTIYIAFIHQKTEHDKYN